MTYNIYMLNTLQLITISSCGRITLLSKDRDYKINLLVTFMLALLIILFVVNSFMCVQAFGVFQNQQHSNIRHFYWLTLASLFCIIIIGNCETKNQLMWIIFYTFNERMGF